MDNIKFTTLNVRGLYTKEYEIMYSTKWILRQIRQNIATLLQIKKKFEEYLMLMIQLCCAVECLKEKGQVGE